jgi:hypothetical protein
VLASIAVWAVACAGSNSDPVEITAESTDAVIGGSPANASFDAVGTIYGPGPDGKRQLLCTATLIGADRVLTDAGCFVGPDGPDSVHGVKHEFRVGPDSAAPYATFPIRGWTRMHNLRLSASGAPGSPSTAGGPSGAALAMGFLSRPVTDVKPLPLGVFAAADVGKPFAVVGFGQQSDRPHVDPGQEASLPPSITGTRRMGTMTLRAIEGGGLWKAQYPSFEAYVKDAAKYEGDPALAKDPAFRNDHLAIWNKPLTDADAVLGGRPGNAAAAEADVGGPILKRVEGTLTLVAVVRNWRYMGPRPNPFNPFLMPMVAATFGHEGKHLVASRSACGLVSTWGDCVGDAIVRCSGSNEGVPHIVKNDCAAIGMKCLEIPGFSASSGLADHERRCVEPCASSTECAARGEGECKDHKCQWWL